MYNVITLLERDFGEAVLWNVSEIVELWFLGIIKLDATVSSEDMLMYLY